MATILEVKNLTKHYKHVKAVDEISFAIPEGICFGLLGPNGAGKTTTIEMIEGISEPTHGDIYYRGQLRQHPAVRKAFAQRAGIQFQKTALMDFLTVKETLQLFSSFYPVNTPIDELIHLCHLEEFLNGYANKLSGGQQQRLLLALALVNDPDLLFLDEPTTGLDPQARHNFWNLIDNIKKKGKTIVLTTHYMEEAETLCDSLIIIDHGKIIVEGEPQQLLKQHFTGSCITLNKNTRNLDPVSLGLEHQITDDQIEIFTESVDKTLLQLMDKGISLDSLSVRSPSLEDLFLKLTGHSLRN